MREEDDSPIVRSNNDSQVLDDLGRQSRDIETYIAHISKIMMEVEAKESATMDQEFKLETLDSPTSSRQQQQVTISSSYLSQMLSSDKSNETADNDAHNSSCANEDAEKHGTVEELMRRVRKKLQQYETGSVTESTCSSNKEVENHDESIGNIIEALAKVKSAMSESQSARSTATGDSSNNRRDHKGFRLPSPRMKSQNPPKSSLSTPTSKDCVKNADEKKTIFGDEIAQNSSKLGRKLKYKLRSPRPPKSPMTRNVTATKDKETTAPKASTPKLSSVSKPPLSPAPAAHKPIMLSVSADPDNASVEGVLQSPSKQNEESKLKENQGQLDVKSAETDASCASVSLSPSPIATTKPKREITEVLQWTYSGATSASAQDNGHEGTDLQSDAQNIEEGTEQSASLEVQIQSPQEDHDSNEGKGQLSPVTRIKVESDTATSTTENCKPKREIDDILKWADESQVLEVNKTLTPKHVPKEGPAWGFINGKEKKKKNLRERASKAVKALRRGRGGAPRFVESVAPSHGTTTTDQRTNASKNVAGHASPRTTDTLDELEENINDTETGLDSNLDERDDDASPRATTAKLPTSHRVDLLVLDTADTRDTRETTSVACSRTTVPVANKTSGNRIFPPQRSAGKTNSFGTKKPAPIIEFQEEHLETEASSHSFSSYSSEFGETEDEGEDISILSGSGSHDVLTPRTPTTQKMFNDPVTRLEMSFSKSGDSLDRKRFGSDVRSISDLSSVFMEETKAVADELRLDMKDMSKGWLCFL
eukprot:scaffold34647_cov182-Amphora_coffeaeformis.AAC.3